MFAISEQLGPHQTSQHISPVVSKEHSPETIILSVPVSHKIRAGITAVKIAELLLMVRPPSYSGMQRVPAIPYIHPRRCHPDPKGRVSGPLAWSGGKAHPRAVFPSRAENPRLVGVTWTCPASPRTEILQSVSGVHGKQVSREAFVRQY